MRACLALLAFLAVPSVASADSVSGTRFDLHERAHLVEVRVERGHAVLVITRTVDNLGPRSDQALFWLDVPDGAVATRLRTAGTGAKGEPIWFEGELMEAESAAAKYKELTGIGGYYPKDPALLSWRSQGLLALQVFPVLPRSSKTVEYTLKVPMTYEGGAYKVELPQMGTEATPPRVRFVAARPEDRVEVNGVAVTPASTVVGSRSLEVRLSPGSAPLLDGALASFGFGPDRVLFHARVAAAPRLGQAPAHASVALLIDTSRSMAGEIDAALAAARAYLTQLPSADVEVLTFDRKVSSPFGGPLPAREALARLSGFQPTLGNGSALDDALARADARLANAPVRRIVLVTDLRTRSSLTPDRLKPVSALLHLATVVHGAPELHRDDGSPWADVARKTGGLLWRARCSQSDPAARAVFEEWVRPKRIEKLAVKGMPADFTAPHELVEGAALEHLTVTKAQVAQVAVEGELWSRPVRYLVSPSADEARLWSAMVFGSRLLQSLSDKEQMTLALHGRAVSPVTSYLAIEPGVRPSTDGLEPGETFGAGGLGLRGMGPAVAGVPSGTGRCAGSTATPSSGRSSKVPRAPAARARSA